MNAVFADTFYFLGLLNRADESHSRCAAFAREYRGAVVTSAYVLVEVADGLALPQHRVQVEEPPSGKISVSPVWAREAVSQTGRVSVPTAFRTTSAANGKGAPEVVEGDASRVPGRVRFSGVQSATANCISRVCSTTLEA